MKDTFYFSHDYNTRQDIKVRKLLFKHGCTGYGVFWAIIEDLYNNSNALPTDYESLAYELRVDIELLKSVINDFDLFVIKNDYFGSVSIEKRLDERNEKSIQARKSAFKRWGKTEDDANALPPNSKGNAIKERKGKELNEIKEKDNIDNRKLKFSESLKPFLEIYGKEMLIQFYNYWTEPNKSNTKFRQEMEKTWDLTRRLNTWASNDKSFKNTKKDSKFQHNSAVANNVNQYFKNKTNENAI